MPRLRLSPPRNPVRIQFDGDELEAEAGESLAHALVANGYIALARSPKFHRPRGPACMRGACDGCLVRVDGISNTPACLTRVAPGMRVLSQNTVGVRELDLLRVTDWFFPNGLNHHELFAGVPGIQTIMQGFARRVAGLGTMPDQARSPLPSGPAKHRTVDVLVLGGGPSGLLIAKELARLGHSVEVLDDALELGGSLRALPPAERSEFGVDDVLSGAAIKNVRLRPQTIAGAVFEGAVLIVSPDGAELLQPRVLVLATGAHDTLPPFDGNDLPGVMSVRAAGILVSGGVSPGRNAVVVSMGDNGPFAASASAALGVQLIAGSILSASGTSQVTAVTLEIQGRKQRIETDALLVCSARAPAYELAVQCGASVCHTPSGYVPESTNGHMIANVYGVGELMGTAFSAEVLTDEARRVAAQIALRPD